MTLARYRPRSGTSTTRPDIAEAADRVQAIRGAGQIFLPAERRFSQASTTRADIPASAALPQARGS